MKATITLFLTTLLATSALATPVELFSRDRHDECACHFQTNGKALDSATDACCGTFGGTTIQNNDVAYPGKYCRTAVDQIGGDEFFTCCTQHVGKGSGLYLGVENVSGGIN